MNLKKWESVGHVALGFLSGLLPLYLLVDLRERKQLPPENNRYPVMYVRVDIVRDGEDNTIAKNYRPFSSVTGNIPGWEEYWAKARVMDTLNDTWEYGIGRTIGYVFVAAFWVWIGTLI